MDSDDLIQSEKACPPSVWLIKNGPIKPEVRTLIWLSRENSYFSSFPVPWPHNPQLIWSMKDIVVKRHMKTMEETTNMEQGRSEQTAENGPRVIARLCLKSTLPLDFSVSTSINCSNYLSFYLWVLLFATNSILTETIRWEYVIRKEEFQSWILFINFNSSRTR